MMLALGMFVFERRTLPYQSMQHSKDYRWAKTRSSLPVRFILLLPAVVYPCWLLS